MVEYIDLLTPLGTAEHTKFAYIRFLADNPHEQTLSRLLAMLDVEEGRYLIETMSAIGSKGGENPKISERILTFIDHEDPEIRSATIFVLYMRDYREAFPAIVKCLDDPSATVRAGALRSWPWYSYDFKQNPGTRRKIRELANDPEECVRGAACKVLSTMHSSRYFYFLWFKSLFDTSKQVRQSVHLNHLVGECLIAVLLMTYWPTLILSILFWRWSMKNLSIPKTALRFIIVLSAGYVFGVGLGWILGRYYASDPLVMAIILIPGLTMPYVLFVTMFFSRPSNRDLCRRQKASKKTPQGLSTKRATRWGRE